MTRHLEPVPGPGPDDDVWDSEGWDETEDDLAPLRRPAWWRVVAIVVVVSMVVATPVAYALYVLTR